MDGWRDVESGHAGGRRLSPVDLHAYYDGAEPAWRHARAPEDQIPRRQVVADTLAVLSAPQGQTMVLLVGPGGQGRSTAVRQAAVDLATLGRRVLFRERGAALDTDAVSTLPPCVLVSDDAQEIAAEVEAAVEALCGAGRRDVHWLLTARDDDWQATFRNDGRRFEPSWDRLIELWPARGARTTALAVTPEDAARIAAAWGGEVAEDDVLEAGSLLGASLGLRHGADGLVLHVETALAGMPADLARAFLSTAVAGAVGIDGVDLAAIAAMAGVDPVVLAETLGHAGLTSSSGGVLRTRDPAVALAAFHLAASDLEVLFRDLVAAGMGTTSAPGLSARLQKLGVDSVRADGIATTCADTAAEGSDRLLFTIARAVTYRRAGRLHEAADILRATLPAASVNVDWNGLGRNYLLELSVSSADIGLSHEAIVLAVLALSDLWGLDRPTTTDVKLALAHLGALCMELDNSDLPLRYGRLLRVTALLGPKFTPKWDQRTRSDFRRFGVYADDNGIPAGSLTEAFIWLADGLDGPNPLPASGPPEFRQLHATLGAIAAH